MLISLGRYPHALVSCASAIEGAIKAHFGKGPDDKDGFQKLVTQARNSSGALRQFEETDLDNFRTTRNRMIHHGFTPKDDHVAGALLLQIGLPFLDACYQELFGFSLEVGLLSEFHSHLEIATEVYQKAKTVQSLDLSLCFIAFAHQIRWSIKPSFMANWESRSLERAGEGFEKSDSCKTQKQELEKALYPSWTFNCPICGEIEAFVCEMDDGRLDMGQVALLRSACVNCGLVIGKGLPFLTDELCQGQVEESQSKILRSLGITPGN